MPNREDWRGLAYYVCQIAWAIGTCWLGLGIFGSGWSSLGAAGIIFGIFAALVWVSMIYDTMIHYIMATRADMPDHLVMSKRWISDMLPYQLFLAHVFFPLPALMYRWWRE